MTKANKSKDLARPVGADEAAAVRGGDGKTVTKKKGTAPETLIKVTQEDTLISGS